MVCPITSWHRCISCGLSTLKPAPAQVAFTAFSRKAGSLSIPVRSAQAAAQVFASPVGLAGVYTTVKMAGLPAWAHSVMKLVDWFLICSKVSVVPGLINSKANTFHYIHPSSSQKLIAQGRRGASSHRKGLETDPAGAVLVALHSA